jgi:hypothetical protein
VKFRTGGGIGSQAACRQASAVVPVATYLTSRNTRVCSGMITKAFSCYTHQMFSWKKCFRYYHLPSAFEAGEDVISGARFTRVTADARPNRSVLSARADRWDRFPTEAMRRPNGVKKFREKISFRNQVTQDYVPFRERARRGAGVEGGRTPRGGRVWSGRGAPRLDCAARVRSSDRDCAICLTMDMSRSVGIRSSPGSGKSQESAHVTTDRYRQQRQALRRRLKEGRARPSTTHALSRQPAQRTHQTAVATRAYSGGSAVTKRGQVTVPERSAQLHG